MTNPFHNQIEKIALIGISSQSIGSMYFTPLPIRPLGFLWFIGRSNAGIMGSQGQSAQGNSESPPDFSFWAAALTLILTTAYIYANRHFELIGSIIAGLIAAYIVGSIFNMLMRMIIFLIKLVIYTGILVVACYYFMKIFPSILRF